MCVVTMLRAGQYWVRTPAGKGDFSLLQNCPDWLWGPPASYSMNTWILSQE